MKKTIKKIVAMGMMAVLISSNAMAVSAQTKSGKVNGINFNAFVIFQEQRQVRGQSAHHRI